jgi:bifunctional DNase/RNase
MLIAVEVASFALESDKHLPLVVLRECSGERSFTIPVSVTEANAIAMHSLNVSSEKPLAVDLVKNVIGGLGGVLEKAVIIVEGESFSARLFIIAQSRTVTMCCGAGDALAIAMRCVCGIFVDEAVFGDSVPQDGLAQQALRTNIAQSDTLEFGRYFF